jgi:folate-binding protein YgfZ
MSDTALAPISTTPLVPIRLADRGIIRVSGPDAASFLHNLVSNDIERLGDGDATYAALLTPQGKILFDFIVVRRDGAFLVDVAADQAPALAKRLGFYKLRSAVTIADGSADYAVIAFPGGPARGLTPDAIVFTDPRVAALGERAIVPATAAAELMVKTSEYNQLLIANGVPVFGLDFKTGENVPHDVNFDDLNALDFRKGCYVGQEIVSRMKHRGTARRRLVHVRSAEGGRSPALPAPQSEILAGIRSIGTMGGSYGPEGLAIIRLDWAKDALDRGIPITCDGIALSIALPAYATFGFPQTVAET